MNKKNMMKHKDEDELDLRNVINKINIRYKNLEEDIQNLDIKLGEIDKTICELDTQIANVKNIISGETDNQKRGRLFGVLNECLELKGKYHDIYIKGLDTKFKYRREENDITYKELRLTEIDIPKVKSGEKDKGFNLGELIESFKGLQMSLNNVENNKQNDQKEDQKEDYLNNVLHDLKDEKFKL